MFLLGPARRVEGSAGTHLVFLVFRLMRLPFLANGLTTARVLVISMMAPLLLVTMAYTNDSYPRLNPVSVG